MEKILNSLDLTTEFSKNLVDSRGAIFVGSGISSASGVPSWLNLLKSMAKTRLGIDITGDDHLPLVAQYIVNHANGNRGPLIQCFRELLTRQFTQNAYHAALARTNVSTLWTTNYDTLLEDTFRRNFHVQVKSTDDSIARSVASSGIELIKMHGCIEHSTHDGIVATQEDYENFFENRPATAQRLSQDLLEKSFLFIGYSYGDSNINNILVEARRLGRTATRQHFIVLRRVQDDDNQKRHEKQARQDLWLRDLARVGIESCQIDRHEELQTILDRIALGSRGNTVFVTGAHGRVEEENSTISPAHLGKLLADDPSVVLLDGQSAGTSRAVVSAYLEHCIARGADIINRLRVFPNPYAANSKFSNDASLLPILQDWRSPLLRQANVVVVYNGGMGTKAEVETAKKLGCQIIPVPEIAGDLPSQLLEHDHEIRNALQSIDPSYLEKATRCNVCAVDVQKCIGAMLR